MTDFGKRGGDMSKTVYDTNGNDIVDEAESITPGAVVDATKIVGVAVDDTDKGNAKVLAYNSTSGNLEYETPAAGGQTFVDRGDPAAGDFEVGDLTTNNAWHDLDLSGIVTEGATHVCLSLSLECACGTGKARFRKNGNSNEYNMFWATAYNPNKDHHINGFVALDGDRKIEYKIGDITWALLRIVVCGWII